MDKVTPVYRPYTQADREQIKALAVKLIEQAAEHDVLRLPTPARDYPDNYLNELEEQVNGGKGFLTVAEYDDRIIGYAYAYFIERTPEKYYEYKQEKLGELEDLIVLPEYRGQGIGRELLRLMEMTLKEQGCNKVVLFTWPGTEVHQMYAKKGYKDNLVQMVKAL